MYESARIPLEAPSDVFFGSGVFRCQLAPDGAQSVTLRLSGELDLATCGDLCAALDAAEDSATVVSVDLAELEFIDSAGIAALSAAATRMAKSGNELNLVGGEGQVRRVLELVGTLGETDRRRQTPPNFGGNREIQQGGLSHVV